MSGAGGVTETNDDDGFQMPVSSRRKSKKSNADKNKKNAPQLNRQRRSAENYTGKQQKIKARNNGNKKPFSNGPSLSARGWSKPNRGWTEEDNNVETFEAEPVEDDSGEDPIDRASETMASIVGAEISGASNTADDKINAALAATAASTTMASLMNSMGFAAPTKPQMSQTPQQQQQHQPPLKTEEAPAPNFVSFSKGQKMEDLFGDLGERDPRWKEKQFPLSFSDETNEATIETETEPPSSFASFCKGQSTAGLLGDFGDADPNWKQKVVEEVDENAEEEEDEEDPLAGKSATSTTTTTAGNQQNTKTKTKPKTAKYPLSKLVPHGKAAIHLSIESFGIAHGAPSRGSRDRSGSPHTQPLAWLDMGDSITDPVPEHLEFHDGLRSGVIKRLLKTAPLVLGGTKTQEHGICWNDDDDDDDESSVDLETVRDFSSYCKKHLAETKIFPSLLEAIHEGGHGYVSPLTMRFSIGSFLGRHRSVVATETVAQHLRYLLRSHNEKIRSSTGTSNNSDNKRNTKMDDRRPITCSVSVGTVHRDVHKRIPQKHYKEDDADYVDKKDRL